MTTYSVQIDGSGCYAAINYSRADDGLPAEEREYDTLSEALDAFGSHRSGSMYRDGDLVTVVNNGRASAPDGSWGPWRLDREADLVAAAIEE